jgi:hypothetical protein
VKAPFIPKRRDFLVNLPLGTEPGGGQAKLSRAGGVALGDRAEAQRIVLLQKSRRAKRSSLVVGRSGPQLSANRPSSLDGPLDACIWGRSHRRNVRTVD